MTTTGELTAYEAVDLCNLLENDDPYLDLAEKVAYIRSLLADLAQTERAEVIASIRAQLADRESGTRVCGMIGIDAPTRAAGDVGWIYDGVIADLVDALGQNGASPDALASLFDLLAQKSATEHIAYRRILRERLGIDAGEFDGALGDAKLRKRAAESKNGGQPNDGRPKVYKLPEILAELEEIRTQQATFWLKQTTDPKAERPPIEAMTRAIAMKCGALTEIEMHTVLDEIERKPPLLERERTPIMKMWKAAQKSLRDEIRPRATDDMIADEYKRRFLNKRMYTRSRWYKWCDTGVWSDQCDATDEIWDQMVMMKDSDVTPSSHKRRSVEERLQGMSMMGVSEAAVDAHPNIINFANGVFDLETGAMGTARHDLYLTTQLPYSYDPDAECPRWLEFLEQVLVDRDGQPHHDTIQFMQQAFGYSLTAWTKYELSFWLQGDGANGKSTLLRILSGLNGTAATSLNLGILERDQYQLANLPGMRVVFCSESPVGLKVADSIIKGLVSGEPMQVRLPYSKPFELTPVCKVWWAMNNPPRVADTSEGFWRRVKVVPFRATFGSNGQVADVNLKDKLANELPGIFNWALAGLRDLEQDGWMYSAEIEEATDAYRESNDVEKAFVEACCIEGPEYKVSGKQLYSAYHGWCKETGHMYKSMTRVAADWARLGYIKNRTGSGVWYHGVGIVDSVGLPV